MFHHKKSERQIFFKITVILSNQSILITSKKSRNTIKSVHFGRTCTDPDHKLGAEKDSTREQKLENTFHRWKRCSQHDIYLGGGM